MQITYMKMLIVSLLLLLGLLITGCVTMPTKQELANLDYGSPLTIDYETIIKEHFEEVLFDPYSAHYTFEKPQRFWYKEPPLFGNKLYAGYMVFVYVNAKNRMGGYVGKQKHGFLFKNNKIIKILEPSEISLMRKK